jgi:hypothetical protein
VPGDFDDEIKILPPLQIRQTTGNPFGPGLTGGAGARRNAGISTKRVRVVL